MKLRMPIDLHSDLHKASIKYGLDKSDIANRAVRKFRNSGLDVATLRTATFATEKTNPITLGVRYELSNQDFLCIMRWYLDLHKNKPEPSPITIAQEDIDSLYKLQNGAEIAESLNDNRIKIIKAIENY